MEDIDRDRFMTPAEAVEYGLIDAILPPPSRTTGSSIEDVNSTGLHHVGVAVPDLDVAVETYVRTFGATLEHREIVSEQGVEAASVLVGGSRVELLAPTREDTPVGRFSPGADPVFIISPTRSTMSVSPWRASLPTASS